ncbi:hypothetical protein AMJ85_09245 [candidate division BRC1 bacterium SM23_51]|nr:MAG: hypothetical protein AMJ85_09245 [candidate division BRC1 bacterium SM23_51]
MKRRLPGFRATLAIAALVLVALAGTIIWWNLRAQRREIARLRSAIRNLTASYPIARLVVLDQTADAEGRARTRVRLVFVDDQGRRCGDPIEATLEGSRIYFEALLMIFKDPLVERGERRSMAFPTRLFSEAIAPERGVALSVLDENGVPTIYDRPERTPEDLSPATYRKILQRFWHYANHPDQAGRYGIKVLQGEAVFTEYQVKRYYSVFVEADGGLSIRPELIWWEE